jgi:hypothetical protein
MKNGLNPIVATALLAVPLLTCQSATAQSPTAPTSPAPPKALVTPAAPTGAPALVAVNLLTPMPRPGFPRTGPPALSAYAIDASGKRDEKVAAAVVCPGQCVFRAPAGTRVEIASAQPVHAWTGPCAKSNPSPEPAHKCIVTLEAVPVNPMAIVGAVLE